MNTTQLERLTDPLEFRKWYRIPTDSGPRPWIEVAESQQVADHDALVPGIRRAMGLPAEGGYSQAYLERPRAGGKTADMAMVAANILFGSRERRRGLAFAEDKDQSRLLRDALDDGVRLTPDLDRFLELQSFKVVNPHTGSALEIMASDVASSWGPTPDFILVDELTHWSAPDLWDSLVSSAGKSADCLLLVGSNAGLGRGKSWHWRIREAFRQDDALYFSRFDGPPIRITPARLDRQKALITQGAFRRVWLNEWLSQAGDALAESDVRACITADGPWMCRPPGTGLIAGLDLGAVRDHASLVGLGIDYAHRRLQLAWVKNWRPNPTVDLEDVYWTVLEYRRTMGLKAVAFDPWQCLSMAQRLESEGMYCEPVPAVGQTLNRQATAILECFRDRRIALFDDDLLVADLLRLTIVEKSYGFKLTATRDSDGHADRASALALALPFALDSLSGYVPQQQRDDGLGSNLLDFVHRQQRRANFGQREL